MAMPKHTLNINKTSYDVEVAAGTSLLWVLREDLRLTGSIKAHHFWIALDVGMIIQPNNVKAQMEGGIIMGMSSVLKEQITIVDGQIQQSNFHYYSLGYNTRGSRQH